MSKFYLILLFFGSLQSFCQTLAWTNFVNQHQIENNETTKRKYYLIKIPDTTDFNKLINCSNQIHIIRTLDKNHCIVHNSSHELKQIPYLKFQPANFKWKLINPPLNNSKVSFTIKTNNTAQLIAVLNKNRIKIHHILKDCIRVKTSKEIITKLIIPLSYVLYVSTESFSPNQESLISDYNFHSNAITLLSDKYPELDGQNFTVGVKDNKPFENDFDIGNKIISSELTSETQDLHATIMSSIIAGNGTNGPNALGVVPKAKIFSSNFKNLTPDPIAILKQHQITIQNHSYGTKVENFYGLLASDYDAYLYQNPEITHIFSSGNAGNETNGMSNLTGNFKMAKNSISVGALNTNNIVLNKSSKGPTFDGRIKPEIVAYSAVGTSNAAALVSGIAQKLQQYYFSKEKKTAPSYLLKALLLNGADDVGTKGIDFESGFGNVNALQSLEMLKNSQFLLDEIKANETTNIEISIPKNAALLKIMLVWNDLPSSPNDQILLKNDLDLKAITKNKTFLPWSFSSPLNSKEKQLTETEDHLNPVEQISIENVIADKYTIQIKASSLISNSQKYALVYRYELKDQFEWLFPNAHNRITTADINTQFIRWKSTFKKGSTGTIEVDYHNTNNWIAVAKNVPFDTSFFKWSPPEITTHNARLRFIADNENKTSYTTASFEIAKNITIELGFNCSENLELRWKKNEAIDFYELYSINPTQSTSEFILKTTDSSAIVTKKNSHHLYYLIPHTNEKEAFTKTKTINSNDFEEKCYFENLLFLKNKSTNNGIINVQLNSLFEVNQILLYKNTTQPELIESRTTISNLLQTYELSDLTNITDFFFEVHLTNGSVINSEIITLPSESTTALNIYPNPVKSNANLFIDSTNPNTLYLFDLQGKLLLQKKLTNETNTIINLNISSGTYIIVLEDSLGNTTDQKLIVN